MADSPTTCPFCNDTIFIPQEFYNSNVECPSCHKQFFLPKIEELIDYSDKGFFECPVCGKKNIISDDFSGKLSCTECGRELEVLNEEFVQCPYCRNNISKNATVCTYCQSPVEGSQQTANESTKILGDQEDKEILSTIFWLRLITLIFYISIFFYCGLVTTFDILEKTLVYGELKLRILVILLSTYTFLIINVLFNWFHGVYKNILRIRIEIEKKSGSQK